MRNHHLHHHRALAHAAAHHHYVVHHAHPAGPGDHWYVRLIEEFSHFSLGWVIGTLGFLLGHFWPAAGLLAAGTLVLLGSRAWGRHRLARAGCGFELRLGEQVSRPALKTFTSTLAGGLSRPLLGASPWVALMTLADEDRATCSLFVSGGLSGAQVRAAVEQALGGATAEQPAAGAIALDDGEARCRVASLAPVSSKFLPLRVDHRVDPAGQLLAALRAQQAGEGGVIQLVLQAPARSTARQARSQAARLRTGRGLQQVVHLAGCDLSGRSVSQRRHDVANGLARAVLVRLPRLAQHIRVVAQRRWLGAPHVLEPAQVGVGDLAEGRAPRAALLLGTLDVRRLLYVLGDELGSRHVGGALVIGAFGYASSVLAPAAGRSDGAVRPALVENGGMLSPGGGRFCGLARGFLRSLV